jgi:sialic acid synthase SpsE
MQLKEMVSEIRCVEMALGNGLKAPTETESQNALVVRKSLVAKGRVQCGELFSPENLGVKRPGDGISPMRYWDYLGQPAERDYSEDELI